MDARKYIPLALTIGSCVGVVATAIFASRDGIKAAKVLSESNIDKEASKKEVIKDTVKATWKCYIPTAIISAATITSIIVNHKITEEQIAALVLAAGAGAKLANDYREAVRVAYGDEGVSKVEAIIAKAHENGIQIAKMPCEEGEFAQPTHLFYDIWTDNWFYANPVALKDVIINMHKAIGYRGCGSVKELYSMLGIKDEFAKFRKDCGQDDIGDWGWGQEQLDAGVLNEFDIQLTWVESDQEEACGGGYYIMDYTVNPEWLSSDEIHTIRHIPYDYIFKHCFTPIREVV